MGLRISQGKINPILQKRQIRKPVVVCRCGLYLNRERERDSEHTW
jgi:hypothetical protein